MKITSAKQLVKDERYYYADVNSPNLSHQPDGVVVYSVVYRNFDKERRLKYGFSQEGRVLKTDKVEVSACNNLYGSLNTYMGTEWIRSRNFYTTLEEAGREALVLAFTRWEPFREKDE